MKTTEAERRLAARRRVFGRSLSGFVDGEPVVGEDGGCWFAKARSSSAALLCQWKAVRESRAMKARGRWSEG